MRLNLPGRIITLDRTQQVAVLDLSLAGARLECIRPLRPRDKFVLQFEGYELFGDVIWADGLQCGVEFDAQISQHILIGARNRHDEMVRLGGWDPRRERAQLWASGRDGD